MQPAVAPASRPSQQQPRSTSALAIADQISRDARTRTIAAAAVVLVHAAYPLGSPGLALASPNARLIETTLFQLVVSFPVNAFILLAFLNLAPRLRAGASAGQRLRALAHRLVPAHLFWTTAYLLARSLHEHAAPSASALADAYLLGGAASHLYFIPLLLAMNVIAPLLARIARTPARAIVGGASIALAAIALARSSSPAEWKEDLAGLLGLVPFAIAGLAFARTWSGVAPGEDRRAGVRLAAACLIVPSALFMIATGLSAEPHPEGMWLANNALALGVPMWLLTLRGRAAPWMVRVAACSLGIYLVHPFFVQGLRLVEARVPALAAMPVALVLPNAIAAFGLSMALVMAMARTRLRRVVA